MRYDRTGMNCSFWAVAMLATPANNMPINACRNHFMTSSYDRRRVRRPKLPTVNSVRERPESELFLGDLPDARQPMRFQDQKKDDQSAEYHQLEVRSDAGGDIQMQRVVEKGDADVQRDRQQHDEGAAEESSQHRSDAADDDHEQDAERQIEVIGFRLDGAQIRVREQRAGHAAIEGADGEGQQLGAHRPDTDHLGSDVHVADGHPLPS